MNMRPCPASFDKVGRIGRRECWLAPARLTLARLALAKQALAELTLPGPSLRALALCGSALRGLALRGLALAELALPGVALAGLMLLAGAPGLAWAERVYRCGPDGREFSQVPCRGASERAVEVEDRRDAEQQAEAQSVADRASASAAGMARARHAARETRRPAGAGSLSGPFGRVRVPFEGQEPEPPSRCGTQVRRKACR